MAEIWDQRKEFATTEFQEQGSWKLFRNFVQTVPYFLQATAGVIPKKATNIVVAVVALHSFLQTTNSRSSYGSSQNFGYDYAADVSPTMFPMELTTIGRSSDAAKNMRDNLCIYI